jgi:hypothetical protein
MSQPVEPMTAVSVVSLAVLCVLGLRKLVLTDRLHALRVAVLTAVLWGGAFYLFSLACSDMFQTGCDVINFESDVYTCTEM